MTNFVGINQVERINGNIILRQKLKEILGKTHIENFEHFFKHFTDNYFQMILAFRKDIEKVNSKLFSTCLYFPQYGVFKENNKIKILVFLPIGTFEVTTMELYKCTNLKDSSECYKCSNYKDKYSESLETLNVKILKTIKELEGTTIKSSIIQFPFTYLNREYSLSIDLRERSLLTLMVYIDKNKQTSTSVDVKDELYINLKNLIKGSLIKRFSNRLRLLLIASKKKEGEFNKEFVASTLAEEFHPEMSLMDALHHCVAAYQEALNYKEFELAYRGDPQTLLMELLKAPSKQVLFPKSSDTYSLEQYYNSYINYILQQLRLTNIGWCRKELGFD